MALYRIKKKIFLYIVAVELLGDDLPEKGWDDGLIHIVYLPIVQLHEPKQTLASDAAQHLRMKMREKVPRHSQKGRKSV